MSLVKDAMSEMQPAAEVDAALYKVDLLVGYGRNNAAVYRSEPKILRREFLPVTLGNGKEILHVAAFGLDDSFERWYQQIILDNYIQLYQYMPKAEIWDCDRVKKILAGQDEEWAVRAIDIAQNGYVVLLMWRCDRCLDATKLKDLTKAVRQRIAQVQQGEEDDSSLPEGIKAITLDLNYCSHWNWGIRVAHFCGRTTGPVKISIIKTICDEDLGTEWVLANCHPDRGSMIYRFYPCEDPMIQTVEHYRPSVNLMPHYL